MIEKERRNTEELFKLMQENPELSVVPMVDYEIVAEDSGRWLGSWGGSYIGEYLLGEEQVHFREDDDMYEVERVLEEFIDDGVFNGMSDEEAVKAYAGLPWIKAIIVNIDLPE